MSPRPSRSIPSGLPSNLVRWVEIVPLRSRLRQRGEWGAGLAVAPIAAPSMGARRTGQGRARGERSERSLDAPERSRMTAFGAAASPPGWRSVSPRAARPTMPLGSASLGGARCGSGCGRKRTHQTR